jgi:hypothetical protein
MCTDKLSEDRPATQPKNVSLAHHILWFILSFSRKCLQVSQKWPEDIFVAVIFIIYDGTLCQNKQIDMTQL